jgi:hypothetical protein
MLYKNILKHEAGFDYEFEEGTIVDITCLCEDEFGELDFYIDGQPAYATKKEFAESWILVGGNTEKYLEIFRTAFDGDASDDELEKIIDEAADNIDDAIEYSKFYEIVTDMVRMR